MIILLVLQSSADYKLVTADTSEVFYSTNYEKGDEISVNRSNRYNNYETKEVYITLEDNYYESDVVECVIIIRSTNHKKVYSKNIYRMFPNSIKKVKYRDTIPVMDINKNRLIVDSVRNKNPRFKDECWVEKLKPVLEENNWENTSFVSSLLLTNSSSVRSADNISGAIAIA